MTTGEMAKAPALFLRNATGLVKGWSGFDAFAYAFMSVNLVALGMFYSLAIFGYVPDGSAVASIIITAIGMTFMSDRLRRPDRRDAPSGRRLRLADAHPRRHPRRRRRRRVRRYRDVPRRHGARALTARVTYGGMALGGDRRRDARPQARRHRLRPLRDGLVVHPRALGADLRASSSRSSSCSRSPRCSAGGPASTSSPPPDGGFAVSIATIVITSALVALGMAGYARIQRWCLYIGLGALALMFILMAISSQESFQAAYDKANAEIFGVGNAYQATIDQGTAQDVAGGAVRWLRLRRRDPAPGAVHAVLPAVPELGVHALRRGPRRG